MSVYQPTYKDPATGARIKSSVWWFKFRFGGRLIRESARTTRKTIAVEAERRRKLELERAFAGIPAEEPVKRIQTVSDVLKAYRANYPVNHRPKSVEVVENRSAHLERLLGNVLLPDLTQERILDYMRRRRAETKPTKDGAKAISARTVNLEIAVLSRALGRTWKSLWPKLAKLEENRDVGRALEAEEEAALLAAAAKNPSPLIYPFLNVLAWTGMRADEARTLRWVQVDFYKGEICVGKAKTEAGTRRVIPMSTTLRAVLEQYAAQYAYRFGPLKPDWYVFPYCHTRKPVDPTRPATSLKTAWETVRTQAGVACRLHDLRHSFCTKLAEAGVPEPAMLDMMGHVSASMLRRYSHIRAQARRDAIAALEARSSAGVGKELGKVSVQGGLKPPVSH
jgi:integrase